jgi:hypothetical protein
VVRSHDEWLAAQVRHRHALETVQKDGQVVNTGLQISPEEERSLTFEEAKAILLAEARVCARHGMVTFLSIDLCPMCVHEMFVLDFVIKS